MSTSFAFRRKVFGNSFLNLTDPHSPYNKKTTIDMLREYSSVIILKITAKHIKIDITGFRFNILENLKNVRQNSTPYRTPYIANQLIGVAVVIVNPVTETDCLSPSYPNPIIGELTEEEVRRAFIG